MNSEEQLKRLNEVLSISKNSTFYKKRLPDQSLQSLSQLKSIPLTTKENLREHSPFGFISVPKKDLYQYHETSGTTGVPTSSWFTKEDLNENAQSIAESGIHFNENDTVLIRFPYALTSISHFIHSAVQKNNATVIPAGARTTICPLSHVIEMMQTLEVSVLACISLQAVMLGEVAEMLDLDPKKDFPHLRAICNAGEPLTKARRKLLQEMWGVPIFDFYGMTETGNSVVDCEFRTPHLIANSFFIELLDDDFKNEVNHGEIGNLVITTLKKKGSPVIRYATGDRARLVKKQCDCGKDCSLEIRGRSEDVIKVRHQNFDLHDLNDIVSTLPYQRFWAVGSYPNGNDGLHFIVEVENKPGEITPELIEKLRNKYQVNIRVDLVQRGTLYHRGKMMTIGLTSKPKYIYTSKEISNFIEG